MRLSLYLGSRIQSEFKLNRTKKIMHNRKYSKYKHVIKILIMLIFNYLYASKYSNCKYKFKYISCFKYFEDNIFEHKIWILYLDFLVLQIKILTN